MRAPVRLRIAAILMLASVSTHSVLAGLPGSSGLPSTQVDVTVTGNNFRFNPTFVEVRRNDAVRINFIAEDRPYSLAIDAFRVSKRASPGHPAVIEFCADQPGRFVFYCDLVDERCRGMRGELLVRP